MPGTALPSTVDLEQLTGDFAASVSERSKGTLDGALQQALARTIEAKVQTQISVVLEGIGDAFYSLDEEWRFSYINRAAESYFGAPRHSMLRKVIWDVFPESEGTDLRRRYEEVFASGRSLSFEAETVGRRGHYLEFHVFPYMGGLGVSFRDWTERRRAEEEMRERQAQISALADNLPLGMVYQMDNGVGYEGRRFIYVSASCERLNGIPAEQVPGDPSLLFNLILPEFRESVYRAQVEAHARLKPLDIEFAIRHAKTGEIRWQRIVDAPRRLPDGNIVWDGIQIDITDQKRAEEHQRLLLNELNHRVKNTLATVQSLAAQSFRGIGAQDIQSLPSACATFEARLFALARAHDVLTRENWEGADFSDVLAEACTPYRSTGAECRRIEVEGPDLRVSPSIALSVSMVLHELFTNALKYGALSNGSGSVRISWSILAGSRLSMRWEERGGPPVEPPSRKGFGSRLIQDGLARELNGTVVLNYDPDGVVCTVDVPLS
ncbi:sensor histidine kinase [Microvirga calopogonii]|uniref:sensor histidine kinase n=1 Tax=Microvirga calopogonii TaxID=2078013 RepID=UPI001FE1FE37|nr:HWE histidine kinase domain-containing protein [Microvirga calopogonii]